MTVVLRNRGPDAYRPDTYGGVIRIRRTLKLDGQSAYALLNERGASGTYVARTCSQPSR